jgi:hypothetical protein
MKTPVGQNFPFQAASAVGRVAVRKFGPKHLERGGPAARARNEVLRGRSIADAAAIAARQGKGHVAELRIATEHCLHSGLTERPYHSAPNARANDPHIDVQVRSGRRLVNGAQVGVGHPTYLRRKVRRSKAPQVVINSEAREVFQHEGDVAFELSSDSLVHDDTRSNSLSAVTVESEARDVLEGVLLETPSVPEFFKLSVAVAAGVEASVLAAGRSLLFGVVSRLYAGQPLDRRMVEDAFEVGQDAFMKGGIQAYVLVSRFLERAGKAFNGRLLRAIGGGTVVAGALAEVIVVAAKNLIACLRNEITFEEVCRRVGVAAFSAAGSVAGLAIALRATRGMHPLLQLILCAIGAAGGGYGGHKLGSYLLPEHAAS